MRWSIALAESARRTSAQNLNQLLADSIVLKDLYKKHHWQVAGPTFYQLHLLFDKHAGEQENWIDMVAERVQALDGVTIAMPHDIAETTRIPRAPRGCEGVSAQIARLLQGHEILLEEARAMARQASTDGDDGTNDLIVGTIIRGNELQVWFLAQHAIQENTHVPAPTSSCP